MASTTFTRIARFRSISRTELISLSRVLLTGIHLMRTGEVEANLVRLNEIFQLSYIANLVELKTTGPEKGQLEETDREFHAREYERLRSDLQEAFERSRLPETPKGAEALNDLLVRVRLSR